jgi:hypothetical protein
MQMLIDKQQRSKDKIIKPDFSTKTGREFLAFYLQTKFKQILQHDKKTDTPVFKEINPNFISKFSSYMLWQGVTPAPLNIAFVLQNQYRTHTNYLYNLQNSCYNVFTT